MKDFATFDRTQIVNGIAILLSFYLGYKFAQKKVNKNCKLNTDPASSRNVHQKTNVNLFRNNYKMVLLVRNDLKMSTGKIAAQCGHGAVGAYQKARSKIPEVVRAWDYTGCAKIALRVETENELLTLKKAAEDKSLITCLICDAGRTQISPNTKTVLAIGPGLVENIDQVTGHLKLL